MFNFFISNDTFTFYCYYFKRLVDTALFLSWTFRLFSKIFCRLLVKMFRVVRNIIIIMVYILFMKRKRISLLLNEWRQKSRQSDTSTVQSFIEVWLDNFCFNFFLRGIIFRHKNSIPEFTFQYAIGCNCRVKIFDQFIKFSILKSQLCWLFFQRFNRRWISFDLLFGPSES